MRLQKIAFGLALAAFLGACSSTVNLQVRKAPTIDMPGIKVIALDTMVTSGSLNLDLMDTKGGIAGALLGVAVDVGANMALANDSKNKAFSVYQVNGFNQQLLQNGYFTLSNNNPQARLKGSIVYSVTDTKGSREYTRKDGSKYNNVTMDRKADVDVQLQVVDARGTVLGANTLHGYASASTEGATSDAARNSLPGWEQLVRDAIARTWVGSVRSVAPYTVTESRTLAKGDSKLISKGNDAAEDGDWTMALSFWNDALQTGNTKDRAAANHNLAIKQELDGNLQASLDLLVQARQIRDDDDWRSEELRLRARIDEEERLRRASKAAVQAPNPEPAKSVTNDPVLQAPQKSEGPKSINKALSK